ncbi:pirin-like C-terminal cupin domain-containing protein [Acholeplasma hippikon]|uniref:Pirin C-terminal cupin domain n=1 Tax=Acholeplasma hippikon TaxID=264636 RepID=A0A449BLD5_9MOLU|nr:pirin-like C-terminal cupin domain-containing protein [Acholeplasma hippikon]VEU83250.1 Pirin C-terminal cupin domain [Acholeplasma hippikon]
MLLRYYEDNYPEGNINLAPNMYLENTMFGNDFNLDKPFRMYEDKSVPGFPRKPFKGFDLLTIVLEGYLDYADHVGNTARLSADDLLWAHAGSGLVVSQMVPLINQDSYNSFKAIHLWLNLPKNKKQTKPEVKVLFNDEIKEIIETNDVHKSVKLKLITGKHCEHEVLSPVKRSYAAVDRNVKIMLIDLEEGSTLKLRSKVKDLYRLLYYDDGLQLKINGDHYRKNAAFKLKDEEDVYLESSKGHNKLILLEGITINEPMFRYGSFVLNTEAEVILAYREYKETEFGDWPYEYDDSTHGNKPKGFRKIGKKKVEKD